MNQNLILLNIIASCKTSRLKDDKTVSGFSQTQQYILFYFILTCFCQLTIINHLYKTQNKEHAVQIAFL